MWSFLGDKPDFVCVWSGGSGKIVTSDVGVAFVWNFL